MSQPVEALPEDIARLLEREKGAYPVDPHQRRAVLSRVEMAIALGGGPLGGGGPASPAGAGGAGEVVARVVKKGVAGKMAAVAIAAFVGGGVTGGAIVGTMARTPPAPMSEAARHGSAGDERAPTAGLTSSLAPPLPAAPEPHASASSAPEAVTPPAPPRPNVAPSPAAAATTHGDLIREREILDAARAALARGQAQDAIAALEEHARRWPNGDLAAEREVVLIQALVAAGRLPEARARAARFHQAFPKSIFAPAIDSALGAAPATP